jgi:hypothetical protein
MTSRDKNAVHGISPNIGHINVKQATVWSGMRDRDVGRWFGARWYGSMAGMNAVQGRVVTLGLTCRRHVDYGRVRSAICPAY